MFVICIVIFGYSVYVGFKKGIKLLLDINFWLVVGLLLFIFIVGLILFMANIGLDVLGWVMSNIIKMVIWLEFFVEFNGFEDIYFL